MGFTGVFGGPGRDCLLGDDPDLPTYRCDLGRPFEERSRGNLVDLSVGNGVGAGGGLFIMTDGSRISVYATGLVGFLYGIDTPADIFTEISAMLEGGHYSVRSEADLDNFAGVTWEATVGFIVEFGGNLPMLVDKECNRTVYTGTDLAASIFFGISVTDRIFTVDGATY
ncbi:hypothetical protein HC928_13235 [bacterium]|nr:hypothetical protein [bacterium]